MKSVWLICLLMLILVGCGQSPTPEVSASPSPELSQLELGHQQLSAEQYEEAAISFRELLDQRESQNATEEELEPIRQACTRAMVQAGGYVSSRKLWMDLAAKNPDSNKEATRMASRAEKFMLMQADELVNQALDDAKAGHQNKALSTIRAAQELYAIGPASEGQVELAKSLEKKILSGQIPGEPEQ